MANRLTDKLPPKISSHKGAEVVNPGIPQGSPGAMLRNKLMKDKAPASSPSVGMSLFGAKEPPEPASSGVDFKQGLTAGSKNLKGACSYLKC